jgi:hypothetical protein
VSTADRRWKRLRIIDWLNPLAGNDLLLVSQMTVTGALYLPPRPHWIRERVLSEKLGYLAAYAARNRDPVLIVFACRWHGVRPLL